MSLNAAAVVEIVRLVLIHGVGPVIQAINRSKSEEPTVEEIERLLVKPPEEYFENEI